MNADFVNPFLKATLNVLEMMAFVKPVAGKPYLKKDKVASGDISGVIGLTGATKGVVIISLSKEAALKIVGGMLGETLTELNDDIKDAVGEITNMISGDARRALSEKGHNFEAGLPSVITGKNHEIESITSGPTVAIPFTVDGAQFVVETSFEK
ncbi:MAG: chemotaxis protein CheX [Nitrospinota bacterium]|nr:chemotaxis protein CheX [Nitrospinota bacterium]